MAPAHQGRTHPPLDDTEETSEARLPRACDDEPDDMLPAITDPSGKMMSNRKKASLRRMVNRGQRCLYPNCPHTARSKGYCQQHYFIMNRKKYESKMQGV